MFWFISLTWSLLAWFYLYCSAKRRIRQGYIFRGNPALRGCGGDDKEEEQKYEAAVAPAREYQADIQQLFKEVYKPYIQDVGGLWSQYGKPIQQEQLKTYQEVGLPAYRALGTKLAGEVESPWLETGPIFEKIWKQTREKTAAEYAPMERQTSQRLAGAGALDTGAALKLFGDIQQSKYKSLETQAIDQALQEFSLQTQAKQQSYTNMFQYLSNQPSVNMSPVTNINYQPEVIPPYVSQDTGGWSWGDVVGGALAGLGGLFDSGGGGGGGGQTSSVIQGGQGGYTGYSPQYGQVWSPYASSSSVIQGGQGGYTGYSPQYGQVWSPYA